MLGDRTEQNVDVASHWRVMRNNICISIDVADVSYTLVVRGACAARGHEVERVVDLQNAPHLK